MVRVRLRSLAILAGLATPIHADGQSGKSTELPDLEERMYIASRLHTAIQMYFAHWEGVPELDFDGAYREYLAEAITTENRLEWTLASMRFIARLRNGHSWFYDGALRPHLGKGLDFRLRYVGGDWVVTESRVDGLAVGDVVRSIDDREFESFYREKSKYIPASTDRYARSVFSDDLYAGFLFPMRFTLRTTAGDPIAIDRTGEYEPTSEGVTEGRWLAEGRVGYIRIPSFGDPEYEDRALEYLDEFRSAEALVIDVRGNRGGNTPGRLTAALMDRPYRWYSEATPFHMGTTGNAPQRYHLGWSSAERQPDSDAYAGEVAILINEGCHSACEDFIVPFKDNGRAVLIGVASAGSSGQPHFGRFAEGINVGIGAKRELFPDGSTFEGVGVAPDVPLSPTREAYRANRDPVLERVMSMLGDDWSGAR